MLIYSIYVYRLYRVVEHMLYSLIKCNCICEHHDHHMPLRFCCNAYFSFDFSRNLKLHGSLVFFFQIPVFIQNKTKSFLNVYTSKKHEIGPVINRKDIWIFKSLLKLFQLTGRHPWLDRVTVGVDSTSSLYRNTQKNNYQVQRWFQEPRFFSFSKYIKTELFCIFFPFFLK